MGKHQVSLFLFLLAPGAPAAVPPGGGREPEEQRPPDQLHAGHAVRVRADGAPGPAGREEEEGRQGQQEGRGGLARVGDPLGVVRVVVGQRAGEDEEADGPARHGRPGVDATGQVGRRRST